MRLSWLMVLTLLLVAGPIAASGDPSPSASCESLPIPSGGDRRLGRTELVTAGFADAASGGRLLLVGTPHMHLVDPAEGEQIRQSIMETFVRAAPTLAFYEGPTPPPGTRPGSGEPSLVRQLASVRGIPSLSSEPPREQVIAALKQGFSDEEIAAFMAARRMVHRQRGQAVPLDVPPLADDVNRRTLEQSMAELRPLGIADLSYDRFLEIIRAVGDGAPVLAPDWFTPILRPDAPNRFRTLNNAENAVRNRHMRRVVGDAVAAGGAVILVIGRTHLFQQRDYFRCRFGPEQ